MKKIIFTIIALTTILIVGCGPKKTVITEELKTTCYPENLKVNVNSEEMEVVWQNKCKELISGYNIYISETPLNVDYPGRELPASVKPHNTATYAGDTNPDDGVEIYEAKHLENGKKYYVSVRLVFPDRTLSKPTNEVMTVCGPRGEIEMSIRYNGEHDGFSFENNEYVKADQLENDLYFFSKDGEDYLNSPIKLDGFLKDNKLKKLKLKGDLDHVRKQLETITISPNEVKIAIAKGDWIWLKTTDGKSALIKVVDIYGEGKDRRVKLSYAYIPIVDELVL